MPIIKLPDGKDLTFQSKVTGLEVAEKISKSLSKQALVVSVDGQLKDLTHTIQLLNYQMEKILHFNQR